MTKHNRLPTSLICVVLCCGWWLSLAFAQEATAQRKQTLEQTPIKLKAIAAALQKSLGKDFRTSAYPAGFGDSQGKLLLSWRVALLPALGEQKLFDEFHLNEPWDSEHNKRLIPKMPAVFQSVGGANKEGHTYLRGFASDLTMFPTSAPGVAAAQIGGKTCYPVFCQPLIKVLDGTSFTLLVVEAHDSVPWTKPEELNYDAKLPLPRLGGPLGGDFHAIWCDGAPRLMSASIPEATLRLALTFKDGNTIEIKPAAEGGFTIGVVTPEMLERRYALGRQIEKSSRSTSAQMTDKAGETVHAGMVALSRAIPWTKPDDLVFDAEFPAKDNAFAEGEMVFADGSVRYIHIQAGLKRDTFRGLFTIAGGETEGLLNLYPQNHTLIQPTYPTTAEHVRQAQARSQRKDALRQVALALKNFEQVYRHLPPANIYGPDGKPWHSWRVALLPFLGEAVLYKEYDATVPWDHPKNAAVLNKMPAVYRDPLDDKSSNKTRYLLITGKGTAFPTLAQAAQAEAPKTVTPEKPAAPMPLPIAKDGRQAIDYQPFFLQAWQKQGRKPVFYAWEGEKVILLTSTADLDPKTIDVFLKRLDAAYALCNDITGYSPQSYKQHKGKPTIAAVPDPSLMFNLKVHGAFASGGGEVSTFDGPDGDYERVRKAPEQFPTSYFQIVAQNHYGTSQSCMAFNEGSNRFLMRLCRENAKLKDDDAQTRHSLEQAADAYAKSNLSIGTSFSHLINSKPMELKDSAGQPLSPTNLGMLLGSIVLKLREERGGNEWLKKFYRHLSAGPATVGLEQQFIQAQLLNFTIAASLASQSEPSKDFQTRWRFPFDPAVWAAFKKVDWKKPGLTANDVIDALPSEHLLPSIIQTRPSFLTPERRKQDLLVAGSFEGDAVKTWKLESFRANVLSGAIEGKVVKEGQKAAVLRTTINDDTRFTQTVTIKPGTRYLLSGWIKTKDVEIDKDDRQYGKAGATLSIWGGYEHSRSLTGTNDWTYSTLFFDANDRTEVTVCARLGYWFSTSRGEAWFDDLSLIPIGPSPMRPGIASPPPTPGPAAKDNLLVNGSFEEGPEFPPNFGYFPNVRVGSTAIKGWKVTRGNIDITSSRHWAPGHGQRSIDLHGTPGFGGLQQSFKTAIGQRYQVSFLMAGTPQRKQPLHKLAVRAAGKQQEFSFDATGKTQFAVGWERKNWEFVATAVETTLEFHSLDTEDINSGPILDDVSVVALGAHAPGQPIKAEAEDPPAKGTATWKGWPKDAPAPAIAPFNPLQSKLHQEAWAKHLGVPVEYTNSIGMKFRLIPPGEFTMGNSPDEIAEGLKVTDAYWRQFIPSAGPQHKVVITQPFFLGTYEATQESYSQIMGSNPSHFASTGPGRDAVKGQETGKFPVERVSWNDAADFCARLSIRENLQPLYTRVGDVVTLRAGNGYRLPTEAEWEFACRAGTTSTFWNGNSVTEYPQVGRHYPNKASGRTHSVGELKSNPFGLFDVYGNLWEYAQDGWSATTYTQLAKEVAIDPVRLPSGNSLRVIRGGSWMDVPPTSTSGTRLGHGPTDRSFINVGFRVALSVEAVKLALGKPVLAEMPLEAEAPRKSSNDQSALTLKGSPFTSVAYSPDGKWIATAAINRSVTLWDAEKAQPVRVLDGGWCVAFSPDSQQVASAGPGNSVRVWNVTSGTELKMLNGHTGDVRSVAFNRDGTQIASASADKTVRLWDAQTRQLLKTFEGHTDGVRAVVFSPEAKRLVSASKDRTVRVWPLDDRAQLRVLSGHTAEVRTVEFCQDLESILSAGHDSTVRHWAGFEGGLIKQHGHHGSGVMSLAICPDLKWVATAGSDRLVKISNLKSGREQASLSGHTSQVTGVAWHPLGKRLASVSYDGTLKLWDVAEALSKPAPFSLDEKSVTREISAEESKLIEDAGKTSRPLTNGNLATGDLTGWTLDDGAKQFRLFKLPGGQQTALTTAGTPTDASTGRLYQCFKVPADATELRFFLHGGADSQGTYVALWKGMNEVRRAAGRNDNAPINVAWNIESLRGQVVTIEVVDQSTAPWGFIGVHGFEIHAQQKNAAWPRTVKKLVRITETTQDDSLSFTLRGHAHPVIGLALSPDGKLLASGDQETVFVWDILNRTLRSGRTSERHRALLESAGDAPAPCAIAGRCSNP